MDLITSPLADHSSKEGINTLAANLAVLQTVPVNTQRVRHTLKNLCFYPPQIPLLKCLFRLFMGELRAQTTCFRLLCFHIIRHSNFMSESPPPPGLVEELSSIVTNVKKPPKNQHLFLRVLFAICASPTDFSSLASAVVTILEHDPNAGTDRRRRQSVRAAGVADLRMACEVIDLCLGAEGFKFGGTEPEFSRRITVTPENRSVAPHQRLVKNREK
jgi:hypothetical protein